MAGRGSLAGLMPYSDANAVVVDMVRVTTVSQNQNELLTFKITGKRDLAYCQTHSCPGWCLRDRSFQRYARVSEAIERARIFGHSKFSYSGLDRWQISTKLRGNGNGIR